MSPRLQNTPEFRARAKYAAIHAAGAAVFFYVLQRYALQATVETSISWALALGVAAAIIGWTQTTR